MAKRYDAAMPPELDIDEGWTVRFTALDATGALVAGVKVSEAAITAEPLGTGSLISGTFGPFMLVPGPGA